MQLLDRIKRQIAEDGPLTIASYMAICLGDTKSGYYTTSKPFGRKGDFITAPEISQMFGELIGVWCVAMWRNIGAPKRFNLVEMGPGRGTLMADLLRAAAMDQGFMDGVQIRLLEISERLRKEQKRTLLEHLDKVAWVDTPEEIDEAPTLFVANEFLDAVPFHQYVKSGDAWQERMVALQDGELTFMAGAGLCDPAVLPLDAAQQSVGMIFETAPAREGVVARIASHINLFSGAALLIDYGNLQSGFGDTFQAVSAHEFADPLQKSGHVDLTSHVDFSAFEDVAKGDVQAAMTTQGEFLLNMGLLERAGMLGHNKSPAEQITLQSAAERLAGPKAMGEIFKVMILAPNGVEIVGTQKG